MKTKAELCFVFLGSEGVLKISASFSLFPQSCLQMRKIAACLFRGKSATNNDALILMRCIQARIGLAEWSGGTDAHGSMHTDTEEELEREGESNPL